MRSSPTRPNFMNNQKRNLLAIGLGVLLAASAGGEPPATPERKLQLTGDLLIVPVAEPPMTDKNNPKADWGMLEVTVDGKIIHRAHAVHPRAVEDAKYGAFLDMMEYKGKETTLRLRGDSLTPEQAAAIGKIADGVVVGSAIVGKVADNLNAGKDKIVAEVLELTRALASSTHAARRDKVSA